MYYSLIKKVLDADLEMDWVGSGFKKLLADPDVSESRKVGARYVSRRRKTDLLHYIQEARRNKGWIEVGRTWSQLYIAPRNGEWPHYHTNTLGERNGGMLNTSLLILGALAGLPIVDMRDLMYADFEECPVWESGVVESHEIIRFLSSRGARVYRFSDTQPDRKSYSVGTQTRTQFFKRIPGYGFVQSSKKLYDEHGEYTRLHVSSNVSAHVFTMRRTIEYYDISLLERERVVTYHLYYHGLPISSIEVDFNNPHLPRTTTAEEFTQWLIAKDAILWSYTSDKYLRKWDWDKPFDPAKG